MAHAIHSLARQLPLEQRQGARLEGRGAMAGGSSLVSRTRQHQIPAHDAAAAVSLCYFTLGADIGAFASSATTPLFVLLFFRECALRAKSLNSLVAIRRTDERRTQTLPAGPEKWHSRLALSAPSSEPFLAFYARFMR